MLAERIRTLFELLQCSNTEIARFAGCSPSNISRLKSGLRDPGPSSRSVARLAEGVCRYADYENLLGVLGELCGAGEESVSAMIPAVVSWLYEDQEFVLPQGMIPRSRQIEERTRLRFGEKLDRVMTLLDFSNAKLASAMSVDDSLISRYRGGIYCPRKNERIRESLSGLLFQRAEKEGKTGELAALMKVPEPEADAETLADWLFEAGKDHSFTLARALLESIEDFSSAGGGLLFASGEEGKEPDPGQPWDGGRFAEQMSVLQKKEWFRGAQGQRSEMELYLGTDGLRAAVCRFLRDAAAGGGDLLLYSDEPMDWLTGDRDFLNTWAMLMAECGRVGVHIRIIHNIDRDMNEMADSIISWLPLYMSGMIEPYVLRNVRNPRFHHTLFIHAGRACILGTYPAAAGQARGYEYITEKMQLEILEKGFLTMLGEAGPLLRTYPAGQAGAFRQFSGSRPEKTYTILRGFSAASMPEELLRRMLLRSGICEEEKKQLIALHKEMRKQFFESLREGDVHELVRVPNREEAAAGLAAVNFGEILENVPVCYTESELGEHAEAVRKLVETEKNYHLTLLPEMPFRDIQLCVMRDCVAVLRCREPYTAFVFINAELTRAVGDYCRLLAAGNEEDRFTVMQRLKKMAQPPR